MATEQTPEINLDATQATLLHDVESVEKSSPTLVTLNGSVESWEKMMSVLLTLRASNISAVLMLKKSENFLEDEEIQFLFSFLRDWDQLFLNNFLQICEEWVPKEFQETLRTEAKIELKWAREWLMASSDQRIHKYPGLPWRRFIRKIVDENYAFATRFLELAAAPATSENVQAMIVHIQQLLEAKKKVISIFPKRWSKPSDNN